MSIPFANDVCRLMSIKCTHFLWKGRAVVEFFSLVQKNFFSNSSIVTWESTMSREKQLPTPSVPEGMVDLLKGLARNVLREKPENIYEFAAEYFENLLRERDGSLDKGYEKFREYDRQMANLRLSKLSNVSSGAMSSELRQKERMMGKSHVPPTDIGVNGVAMQVNPRENKPKRQPSNRKKQLERSMSQDSSDKESIEEAVEPTNLNASEAEDTEATESQIVADSNEASGSSFAASKRVRNLSSKKPSPALIVIKEEVPSEETEVKTNRSVEPKRTLSQDHAAFIIQNAIRGYVARKNDTNLEAVTPTNEDYTENASLSEAITVIENAGSQTPLHENRDNLSSGIASEHEFLLDDAQSMDNMVVTESEIVGIAEIADIPEQPAVGVDKYENSRVMELQKLDRLKTPESDSGLSEKSFNLRIQEAGHESSVDQENVGMHSLIEDSASKMSSLEISSDRVDGQSGDIDGKTLDNTEIMNEVNLIENKYGETTQLSVTNSTEEGTNSSAEAENNNLNASESAGSTVDANVSECENMNAIQASQNDIVELVEKKANDDCDGIDTIRGSVDVVANETAGVQHTDNANESSDGHIIDSIANDAPNKDTDEAETVMNGDETQSHVTTAEEASEGRKEIDLMIDTHDQDLMEKNAIEGHRDDSSIGTFDTVDNIDSIASDEIEEAQPKNANTAETQTIVLDVERATMDHGSTDFILNEKQDIEKTRENHVENVELNSEADVEGKSDINIELQSDGETPAGANVDASVANDKIDITIVNTDNNEYVLVKNDTQEHASHSANAVEGVEENVIVSSSNDCVTNNKDDDLTSEKVNIAVSEEILKNESSVVHEIAETKIIEDTQITVSSDEIIVKNVTQTLIEKDTSSENSHPNAIVVNEDGMLDSITARVEEQIISSIQPISDNKDVLLTVVGGEETITTEDSVPGSHVDKQSEPEQSQHIGNEGLEMIENDKKEDINAKTNEATIDLSGIGNPEKIENTSSEKEPDQTVEETVEATQDRPETLENVEKMTDINLIEEEKNRSGNGGSSKPADFLHSNINEHDETSTGDDLESVTLEKIALESEETGIIAEVVNKDNEASDKSVGETIENLQEISNGNNIANIPVDDKFESTNEMVEVIEPEIIAKKVSLLHPDQYDDNDMDEIKERVTANGTGSINDKVHKIQEKNVMLEKDIHTDDHSVLSEEGGLKHNPNESNGREESLQELEGAHEDLPHIPSAISIANTNDSAKDEASADINMIEKRDTDLSSTASIDEYETAETVVLEDEILIDQPVDSQKQIEKNGEEENDDVDDDVRELGTQKSISNLHTQHNEAVEHGEAVSNTQTEPQNLKEIDNRTVGAAMNDDFAIAKHGEMEVMPVPSAPEEDFDAESNAENIEKEYAWDVETIIQPDSLDISDDRSADRTMATDSLLDIKQHLFDDEELHDSLVDVRGLDSLVIESSFDRTIVSTDETFEPEPLDAGL